MKKILSTLIMSIMLLITNSAMALEEFSDLNPQSPYYKDIKTLHQKGIVAGYPDGKYRPDNTVTRAEFASIAVRALDVVNKPYTPVKYSDVDENYWAYKYIQVASTFDLVKGHIGGEFLPNNPVSRIEVISIITNALTLNELTYDECKKLLSSYKDGDLIPTWAAMKAAQASNIDLVVPSRHGEEYFEPLENATRGEVAAFVSKMLDAFDKMPSEKLKRAKRGIRLYRGEVINEAYMDGKYAVIPAGVTIPLAIIECSQKNPANNDSDFRAKVRKHYITKEHRLLIPANSEVFGKFKEVKNAKYFRRNDKFVLETVTLANSKTGLNEKITATAVIEPKYNGKNILDKINYYIIRGKKTIIHKSSTGEFTLLEPYRVEIIDEWVTL